MLKCLYIQLTSPCNNKHFISHISFHVRRLSLKLYYSMFVDSSNQSEKVWEIHMPIWALEHKVLLWKPHAFEWLINSRHLVPRKLMLIIALCFVTAMRMCTHILYSRRTEQVYHIYKLRPTMISIVMYFIQWNRTSYTFILFFCLIAILSIAMDTS